MGLFFFVFSLFAFRYYKDEREYYQKVFSKFSFSRGKSENYHYKRHFFGSPDQELFKSDLSILLS
jgi:hypothetical protein